MYDGGGVSPDYSVPNQGYAPITLQLLKKGLIFDFATEFFYQNQGLAVEPLEFEISNAVYEKFLAWLSGKQYSYTTATEKTIKELVETAKTDKYFDFLEKEIEALQNQIASHKEEDLRVFEAEIKRALKEEIISRYHKRQGMIESSFENDQEVKAAIKILNEKREYVKLLQVDK